MVFIERWSLDIYRWSLVLRFNAHVNRVWLQSSFPFLTSRTNPKANVLLSGKKKRLLLKETKRAVMERARMGTFF